MSSLGTERVFKTPLRALEANRRWREANKEKMEGYSVAWARANPAARMVISARFRAKKRGMECSITRHDIEIPEFCPILGLRLECGTGVSEGPGGRPDSMSLDRIDTTKGYVKGNVQVISHLANSMKSYATPEQLLMFAAWVQKEYARG